MKTRRQDLSNYETICIQNTRRSTKEVVLSTEDSLSSDESSDEIEEVSVKDYYSAFVERTAEGLERELRAPQRSLEWKAARAHCLTASNFGAAVGHNPYQSPTSLVKEKLWSTFKGNYATAYGTVHEDDARHEAEVFINETYGPTSFVYPNLVKVQSEPWIAVSPDGLAETPEGTVLLEFKCPMKDTDAHPYAKYKYCMPEYYFDQVQGILGFYNELYHKPIQHALFVVWQPHQTWITKVPYDKAYFDTLYASLKQWYFEMYLPALVHKHNKTIGPGEIVPSTPLNL